MEKGLRTADFDYDLPESFIANDPVVPRDHSKLMVWEGGQVQHRIFYEIADFLRPGDCVVVNQSKVIAARLRFAGKEIFLLQEVRRYVWRCMVKPGKKFSVGARMQVAEDLGAEVLEILEDGSRVVRFDGDPLKSGEIPLPPYIKDSRADFDQYQTVYSQDEGSVAAPTAGLHFTEELIEKLRRQGVKWEQVTLHVGRGTFLPVKSEFVGDHEMHSEFFEIGEGVAKRLNEVKAAGGRVIAVGTTSVRVLESSWQNGRFVANSGETDIYIYPGGYKWKAVDGLVTNFHLPKSSLIMLVASFLENCGAKDGRQEALRLYEGAKGQGYRFYSFGDAMFIS